MRLFLADISRVNLEHSLLLDSERRQRVSRCKMLDDKKRCITSGLLIKRFFGDKCIRLNEWGKPFAPDGGCFNISHSGSYVLFALSDFEIGCDIERIRFLNPLKTGRAVFGENERQYIADSYDKIGSFFKLWTKKESLLKCIGEGFHRSAKSVDVSFDCFEEHGKRYFMKSFVFSDYMISVCSVKNDFPRSIEFISHNELTV